MKNFISIVWPGYVAWVFLSLVSYMCFGWRIALLTFFSGLTGAMVGWSVALLIVRLRDRR